MCSPSLFHSHMSYPSRLRTVVFLGAALGVAVVIVDFGDVISSTGHVLWTFISLPLACIVSVLLMHRIVPLYVVSLHVSDLGEHDTCVRGVRV